MKHIEVQQAAVSLFSEKGFAATGIRDIGAKAGLNSASLYHYVEGKEELLVEIMTECLTSLLDMMKQAYESSADPAVQLVQFVQTHVAFGATNPLTSRVTDRSFQVLSQSSRESIVALRDAFESILERILQRGKLTDNFQISDPRIARLAIIEMNNGIADWFRPSGRLSVAQVQDQFSLFACRMVGIAHPDASLIGPLPTVEKLPCEPLTTIEKD